MTHTCSICTSEFKESPDAVVICEHKQGAVHLGCCIDLCSMDKKPCGHAHGVYEKL